MQLNDVTLREGDQMPGRNFTAEEKLACAHELDSLGVPFIQPGFPATGEKDTRVIKELAETVDATVIALARALEPDIDAAVDAHADVVEIVVPASDLHLEYLLGKSREEMLAMLVDAVAHTRERGATPHVILADAFRTDPAHLLEIFDTASAVPYLTLADSVGARTPHSVTSYLAELGAEIDLSRVGAHFHDDLGCGTANALAAYHAGVGKLDVSVAGLGERAGNSTLEEVVAATTVDSDDDLGLHTADLIPACRTILETLDEAYDERKAVIGRKVTEQESGVHTAAMLSDPATLEPYDPAKFGGSRRLIFGAATGTGGARQLLERVGVEPEDETVTQFKQLLANNGPLTLDEALSLAEQTFADEQ